MSTGDGSAQALDRLRMEIRHRDELIDAGTSRERRLRTELAAARAEAAHVATELRETIDYWRNLANVLDHDVQRLTAERDGLAAMVRRYHDGWYIVSASAPLRDVWCKDHYPDDGYVTEELTPAEAAAIRAALDVSGTTGGDTADDRAEDDDQLDAWIAVHMPSTGEDTAPADLLCENCGKPMSHHDAMAGCWPWNAWIAVHMRPGADPPGR